MCICVCVEVWRVLVREKEREKILMFITIVILSKNLIAKGNCVASIRTLGKKGN